MQDSYFGYYSLSINLKSNIHILADIPHRWEEENEKCAVASLHQRYSLNFSLFFRKRVKIRIYMHRHTSTLFPEVTSTETQQELPMGITLSANASTADIIPKFPFVQRMAFN